MARLVAALDAEFVVQRARLPRVTPCPSWNGVLGCPRGASDPLLSVLSECGRVYLLRLTTTSPAFEFEGALCVTQVLESDSAAVMSMCHAWTRRGDVLAVARDRQLTIYRRGERTVEGEATPFEVVSTVSLRFAASSLDVLEDETGRLLLVVGSAAGVVVYTASADGTAVSLISSFLENVAVAITTFSPKDGEYLAVGSIDGRVMILRRSGDDFSAVGSAESFSKVLAAPRVTSITFSPSGDRVIATTRKGNVYVFTRDAQHRWALDDTFASLVANPKGGATSQTLSCWWGTTPIFALAGRASSSTLELYDVYSRSLLHTLELRGKDSLNGADSGASQDSADLHSMGVVSVPSSDASAPPKLVCIDSDACLTTIEWPFLEFACPR